MARELQTQSLIDHFLQAGILSRLVEAEHPLRFSELKEAGVENSLFMYHANKLINRGLIEKLDGEFRLTTKGARWANHSGVFHSFAVLTPRPLVQFVVRDGHGRMLLAVRKGQLKRLLNDYLLPGNVFRHGETLQQNVQRILRELFGDQPLKQPRLLTVAEIMHTFEDDFVNHVISYIFEIDVPQDIVIQDHSLFTTEWMLTDDISSDSPLFAKSMFVPRFLEKLPSLQPTETFVIENK